MSGGPWARMMLVAALVAGWLSVLHAWQRRRSPGPEVVRKLAHVGTGLIAVALPFLFHDVWPVLLLSAASAAAMTAHRGSYTLRFC